MNAPAIHARTERTVLMTSTLTTVRASKVTREHSAKLVGLSIFYEYNTYAYCSYSKNKTNICRTCGVVVSSPIGPNQLYIVTN